MPLYAAIGFDDVSEGSALREKHRAAHRTYVKERDAMIRLAGAMYGDDGGQCGSTYIFEADSIDDVWRWCCEEPFYKNGVYGEFRLVEWRLALNRFKQTDWVSLPVNTGG